jgi:hypothetical protein
MIFYEEKKESIKSRKKYQSPAITHEDAFAKTSLAVVRC